MKSWKFWVLNDTDLTNATPEMALILAAGLGSRLRPQTKTPKPLTRVLGLTLAERVVCTLLDAGIRRFLVTLGHEAETVRAHFSDIAGRRGVTIDFIDAEDWERGNGASALAAKGRTGDAPFFLVMIDHLFDPGIARALADDPPAPGEMCLAVDRDKDAIFDLDDVTRVKIDDGRIQEIDKTLDDWDAGDTGVMLCTSGLFEGLERAAARNKHGLSDGLRELAGEGRARTVDVTGMSWLDVDTPGALREAERRLMRDQGRKTRDGPVSRHLNRPVSRWLSRYLVRTSVTPNQISLASWMLSCVAAGLMAVSGYPALAAGGVLAQLASVVDGCDGEIARLKHSQSEFGGWFDAVLDRYADAFLLFGLMWHEFAAAGTNLSLVLGFAAIVGSFLNSYTADKYDGLMARRLHGASYFRLGRDVRVFVIFLGAVLNQPLFTLGIVALVMNVEVVRRIMICRRAPAA
ncbi:MAG: CDP-alcohol phosphatidyltransferase family protein [Proteobacteria bacterium]|nr:CDP-alcohol phosphatidyltransferase family protein [Pseudomonadota bacterium]